jgi:hypothetical protein
MSKIRTVVISSLAIGSLVVVGVAPHSTSRPEVHHVAVASCCPEDNTALA